MNTKGRKAEEKVWETKFRHNFSTNYLQDPDVHTLFYVHGSEINGIIRDALRDYMAKHKSKAADPEFQSAVFMAASLQVARGHRPTGSEVLADLGVASPTNPAVTPTTPSRKKETPPPLSAKVVPPLIPQPARDVQAVSEVAEAVKPVTTMQPAANEPAAPANPRPPVVLDFGAEPDMNGYAEPGEPSQKVSQRDKWLARHK